MITKLQTNKTNTTTNAVTIIGNVGQDAIVRTSANGGNIISFSIATSENKKNEKFTEWHSVRALSSNPTQLINHIKRGVKVYVEGYMRYFSYTDTNGNKNYSFYIDSTQIGIGLLKKRPMDVNIGNNIKLKGIVHNFDAELKTHKDETEEGERSYALVKFKLKTVNIRWRKWGDEKFWR